LLDTDRIGVTPPQSRQIDCCVADRGDQQRHSRRRVACVTGSTATGAVNAVVPVAGVNLANQRVDLFALYRKPISPSHSPPTSTFEYFFASATR
jgi:hypothetical protein